MNLLRILAFSLVLSVSAGCSTKFAKPHDAQTTIATAWVTYGIAAHDAAAYVTTCHQDMATVGCNSGIIVKLKQANEAAYSALQNADNAIATMPAGSKGIDEAIAAAQAALVFLGNYVKQVHTP